MRGKLNGRHGVKPGEAFSIGETVGMRGEAEAQPVECAKAAAITALANAYEQELKAHVQSGSLPWGLDYFLEALGDDIATQVKALGVADWVPGRK